MAHHPNLTPGSSNSIPSDSETLRFPAEVASQRSESVGPGSDIAELFSKFEQNSGGTLSPQFSADLALDIVLNQIVEQACLATGATGAAVVLRRGDEFVCRASNGASAPVLGAQMDARSGLSGLCLQSGEVQRCDDALKDPRADPEASRQLGVRSVIVLPLARSSHVLGILEVMSGRPAAFGERDQRTLEVLAARVLRNVERAADPFLLRSDAARGNGQARSMAAEETQPTEPQFVPRFEARRFEAPLSGPIFSSPEVRKSGNGVDYITWLLGLILLAGVALVAVLTGRRLGWNLAMPKAQAEKASSPAVPMTQGGVPASTPDSTAPTSSSSASLVTGDKADDNAASAALATVSHAGGVPDGGLRVLEDGREVFRLPPSHPGVQSAAQQIPARESNVRVLDWSPAEAEARVIHRVEPEYPESARVRQLQGKVVLKIRIRPDGTVADAQLISGEPLLGRAAIDALKQWRFKPQNGSGEPAQVQTQVTLNFRLPQ